jgi:hypothetical protein
VERADLKDDAERADLTDFASPFEEESSLDLGENVALIKIPGAELDDRKGSRSDASAEFIIGSRNNRAVNGLKSEDDEDETLSIG